MTSSRDDLPPGLQSMWRLVKLGYSAEPRLLVFAFAMVVFAALPDALLALWLALLARGVEDSDRTVLMIAAAGIGLSAVATWFLRVVGDRTQRRFRDRVDDLPRVARRAAAGFGVDDRAPRTARLPRSPLRVAQPGLHARPHVHVGVLDRRVDPPARGDGDPADESVSPLARAARRLRAPDGAHRVVAARNRARGRRRCRVARSPGAPPLRARHHCPARQRGAAHRDRTEPRRRNAKRRGSDWYEPVARARWSSAFWHSIAWAIFGIAYVGAVVFVTSVLDASVGGGAARARGGEPAVAVRRRDRRRDRVPARHLARRRAPPRVARGLRAGPRRARGSTGPGSPRRRDPARARLVPLSRHRSRSCSTTSRSTCRPERSWRSSARTARASRRS